MPYGGRRDYKLYTWWKRNDTGIRSFKTEESALQTFYSLPHHEKRHTDIWYQPNKQAPKKWIVREGVKQ